MIWFDYQTQAFKFVKQYILYCLPLTIVWNKYPNTVVLLFFNWTLPSLATSLNLDCSDNEEPCDFFLFFDDIIITFHTLDCIDHIAFITLYYISTIQLDIGFNSFTGSRINCLITARDQLHQSRVDKTCKRACGTLSQENSR